MFKSSTEESSYTAAEYIKLVHSGNNYFDILEKIIEESQEVVHLQTYILDTDSTGIKIITALKKAAARNVKVYLLADAFGSYPFSDSIIGDLLTAGVQFRFYSPLFSSESIFFGRRLHHKIIVADKKNSLVGGINIADKYHGIAKKNHPWLDYAIHIKGNACEFLHLLCEQLYKKERTEHNLKVWKENAANTYTNLPENGIRFRRNDWIKRKNEIYKSYVNAISRAEKSIIIVASYFLPGVEFRKLLAKAALRGVNIKIILAGKSDIPTARSAELYLYDFYLKNKIELFEWENSVMHGKAMIVDNQWATVGSYNLNHLSHYISIELNVDVIDINFIYEFSAHLNKIIHDHCTSVKMTTIDERNTLYNKIKKWVAYNFYKLLQDLLMLGKRYRIKKSV